MAYVRCPEHYFFKYELGFPRLPKKAFKYGFALHETLAYHFAEKKENKKGVPLEAAQEFFVHSFASALEEYEEELEKARLFLPKEYLKKEKESNVGRMVDMGVKGLAIYYKELEKKIMPDLVEEAFSFSAGPGIVVEGRLDLTDTKGVIHEFKTTRSTPPKQDVTRDFQVALYQIAYQTIKGKDPKGISKDYLVLKQKSSRVVRFEGKPSPNPALALQQVRMIVEGMKCKVFYCVHPAESWECSKEWCGYYKFHEELRKIGMERFVRKYKKAR